MPAILRKSLTACEQLPALPPTPRKNSRPPRVAHVGQHVGDHRSIASASSAATICGRFVEVLLRVGHVGLACAFAQIARASPRARPAIRSRRTARRPRSRQLVRARAGPDRRAARSNGVVRRRTAANAARSRTPRP